MVIKIQNKEAAPSAHDEAADAIETTMSTTKTKSGEVDAAPLEEALEHTSEPVMSLGVALERIEVGMAFKMPVASYTMLEFSVKRSVPFNPEVLDADAVFLETKTWVETKLNELIETQQNDG